MNNNTAEEAELQPVGEGRDVVSGGRGYRSVHSLRQPMKHLAEVVNFENNSALALAGFCSCCQMKL